MFVRDINLIIQDIFHCENEYVWRKPEAILWQKGKGLDFEQTPFSFTVNHAVLGRKQWIKERIETELFTLFIRFNMFISPKQQYLKVLR